jgi:hypothetical protein
MKKNKRITIEPQNTSRKEGNMFVLFCACDVMNVLSVKKKRKKRKGVSCITSGTRRVFVEQHKHNM